MKNNLLSITIVADYDSWINNYIPKFISSWEKIGHNINWVNDISEIGAGDIFLLLGCSQIMKKTMMNKNNNILITGGCGFIGSVLTNDLINLGYYVTVVDTQWFGNYLLPKKKLKVIKLDIRKYFRFIFSIL